MSRLSGMLSSNRFLLESHVTPKREISPSVTANLLVEFIMGPSNLHFEKYIVNKVRS